MDSTVKLPPYYNLILLIGFAALFFYFLYEAVGTQEQPLLDGTLGLLCGALAIRNYVKWKEKLRRPMHSDQHPTDSGGIT